MEYIKDKLNNRFVINFDLILEISLIIKKKTFL